MGIIRSFFLKLRKKLFVILFGKSFISFMDKLINFEKITEHSDYLFNTIMDKLINFEKVAEHSDYLFNTIKAVYPPPIIDLLEVQLTEHCNLNCRGCLHFCPLAKTEFLDIKNFENDIQRLSEITSGIIGTIHLMGGEPLLHPEITRFMEVTRTWFPRTNIKIVTNGILLNKMDIGFWENANRNQIWITPTKYPIDIPWVEIEQKSKKHDVVFKYFNNAEINKSLFHFPLEVNGTIPSLRSFIHCAQHYSFRRCVQLVKGKLFLCPTAAYSRHFASYFKVNLDICERDFFDIYKTGGYKDILSYIANPIPFCRYCNSFARSYDHPWQRSGKTIDLFNNSLN